MIYLVYLLTCLVWHGSAPHDPPGWGRVCSTGVMIKGRNPYGCCRQCCQDACAVKPHRNQAGGPRPGALPLTPLPTCVPSRHTSHTPPPQDHLRAPLQARLRHRLRQGARHCVYHGACGSFGGGAPGGKQGVGDVVFGKVHSIVYTRCMRGWPWGTG